MIWQTSYNNSDNTLKRIAMINDNAVPPKRQQPTQSVDFAAIKLVIFDWDGTLFDSVGQIVRSLQYAAQRHQQTLTADTAKHVIGLGLPEVMQTLFPDVPSLHQQILNDYSQHYVEHSKQDKWFDGVAELLDMLASQGKMLAVATGKSRAGLDRVLRQTGSQERFIVTRAASETRSKPDPLMLQQILQHCDLTPNQALMVGDTSYDLDMAQRIGMPRIGVSYGVHTPCILQSFQPVMIADSVTELTACFAKMLSVQTKHF